jgi:hypothetical protein
MDIAHRRPILRSASQPANGCIFWNQDCLGKMIADRFPAHGSTHWQPDDLINLPPSIARDEPRAAFVEVELD